MFRADEVEVELLQNAAERELLRAKALVAQLVALTRSETRARLWLTATLVRLGLAPGEPPAE